MTSTTATKNPKLNVITRIIFCFRGRRMRVRIGLGKTKMARSVMILTGEEDRYSVKISVQCASTGSEAANAAPTGRHWKILTKVNASPATLTTSKVA
jgi:hypothetical protein